MDASYLALERIFHEPSRLAIVSELSAVTTGTSFAELKERCSLTDGNLSRHLSALEKAGVIRIEKAFIGAKPRTTLYLSAKGRADFLEYLAALERVLQQAAAHARASGEQETAAPSGAPPKPVRS